jgi:acyl carrier protein
VRSSIVALHDQASGDKRLVAYFVPKLDSPPSVSELTTYLTERLPRYMLPSAYIMLDHLPLSPNGKVDRQALPKPLKIDNRVKNLPAESTEHIARIAALIADVLEVQYVGPEDNLFDIGATSISMIRIVNSLERELAFRPKIENLYQFPTVAALAESYEEHLLRSSISQKFDIAGTKNEYEEGVL